ncbi:alpha/beta fold hydrolase [Flavobacterium chilense]|uniref:Proline iminopeptidase n=1 Tax=Flavobacterium chilense TaxID=946677 RepID=A0A1M6XEF4_9FLAO|nr:alpha/beta fold hydrolase [Flavobacterium chilense]SHL04293.1 alpha/beta hydrolase fold [Flavobacterium chilense]
MENIKRLFLLLCILPGCLFAQTSNLKLEKATSFFPDNKKINNEWIEWNYLIVPENWEKPNGKTIKIAVAILKGTESNAASNPIVYIEGGPGAGGIKGIAGWFSHPLRKKSDIVLIDVRGTGFSSPKFCPDLGKTFLEILAKNQNKKQDEQQKAVAAMLCKEDLINRNIDINAYDSKAIAKDLNALKSLLKYENWNVYAISFGTYTAQVYANDFPQDIKSLILDSSISDISQYYNLNTKNYMSSLERVFKDCENNPDCNKRYPNLEATYYATIVKLEKNPITVKTDKKIIPSGNFTYNAEDFKVAIQQCLYQKKLIPVLPLLITQFNTGNKSALSALVSSFSGALSLDYGAYYCVSCNEAIPFNSVSEFDKNAGKYPKLKGGLSFYRSDFLVCDKWNSGIIKKDKVANDLSNLSALSVPVLVFSGKFDPITPIENGKVTVKKFKKAFLVEAPVSGHGSSFSSLGAKIANEFISAPNKTPDVHDFQSNPKVDFITDVKINGGISKFATSLNEFKILFFAPLIIAVVILVISIISFLFYLIKRKEDNNANKQIKILVIVTAIIGLFTITGLITAVFETAQRNFYILAFGVANKFNYLFILQWIFIGFIILSGLYFILRIRSISNPSVVATVLFSLVLVGVYFEYWGFLL